MALRSINKQNSPSDGRRAFTFSVAALCVIICFAASAIPVPLIAIWTQALALTTFEVSMTVFAYVGGCLAVLLFFSKLSNYFGRKITVILALAVGIASCLCFIDPHNASALILGRLLQGVFAGLVTSAAMSWTVDTAPKSHVWLGTALSAAGPGIGFIFGTVLSGLSAETGIISGDTLFIGLAVTLAVVLAAAIPAVETMRPGAMSLISALTPSFGIPQKARKVFPLCAVGYIGTWALLVPRLLGHDRQCGFCRWSALAGLCCTHVHAVSDPLCCRRHPLRKTEPAQNAFAFSDRVSGLRNRDVCGSSLCPPDPLCRTPCSMRLHHGRDLLFGAQAPHGIR